MELIHGLHRDGTTIVVITHDNDVAEALPRQIAVRDGHVVADSGAADRGVVRSVVNMEAPR
jgi:putative ABC transport system ATP-binding protein